MNRIDAARIECINRMTPFNAASDKPIMFLDRQNVDCPESYLLAQFRLGREGNYDSACQKVAPYLRECEAHLR